jgi:pentose-5-phosphate-3-epimerase
MIIPAILEKDFEEVKQKIYSINDVTKSIQIDIIDNTIINGRTFSSIDKLNELPPTLDINIHLMVKNPLKYFKKGFIFPTCIKDKIACTSTIITQLILDKSLSKTMEDADKLESQISSQITNNNAENPKSKLIEDLLSQAKLLNYDNNKIITKFINDIKSIGYKVGLSIDPFHNISLLEPFIHEIDLVQFMSVIPGKQGGNFIPEVLDKIKEFRKRYSHITTQIDGGVNGTTLPQVLETGVDNIVVGSAIFNSEDPRKKFLEFSKSFNERTAHGFNN